MQHWALAALAGALIFSLPTALGAEDQPTAQQTVRSILANELRAENDGKNLWSYHELARRNGKALLMEYYETRAGDLHRLLSINGKPLSPQQRQTEDERINRLVSSPEAMRQAHKKQEQDAQQARKFLKVFPDACLFKEEKRDGDVVTFSFKPNPSYDADGMEVKVLHSLSGTMALNVKQRRLVNIRATLLNDVEIWGGLLGHLYKGGTFSVTSEYVAPGDWELKSLDVNMHGRAILFKTISVQEHETYSDYRLLPQNETVKEAAESMEKDGNG